MQLIGAHQILRLLGDFAVHRGQKLRTDGGGQNVLQGRGQFPVLRAVGFVFHQIPHQRFGHRGVDRVHGHVVAVVRGPAQGQFGKIAGADGNAPQLVGKVHQYLGAFPGLTVFIGNVPGLGGYANVLKMLIHRRADGNFHKFRAQPFRNDLGVGTGAGGGAEAGHGDGGNALVIQSAKIKGPGRHQQRQGAVQSAGNRHRRPAAVNVGQPGSQGVGLNVQNFLAAGLPPGRVRRHKGHGVNKSGEGQILLMQIESHRIEGPPGLAESVHPAPLVIEEFHVDFRTDDARFIPFGLGQQHAVFGDEVVSGKHQIGAALPRPRVGVQIGAQKLCRLAGHQHPPVIRLAHAFVAGGGIGDDRGPRHGQSHARGIRHPQILADFRSDGHFRHLSAPEQQISPKGHASAQKLHHAHLVRAGGKVAHFVIHAVIGQVPLGNNRQNFAALEIHGAIVQPSFKGQRRAHAGQQVHMGRIRPHFFQSLQRSLQQGPGQKQIGGRVSGNAQFRQHQQLGLFLLRLPHQFHHRFRIARAVCHANARRTHGHPHKSVLHFRSSASIGSFPSIIPFSFRRAR